MIWEEIVSVSRVFCYLNSEILVSLLLDVTDEDVEIEMVEEDPPFLKGQGRPGLDLSPIKIVKVSGILVSECFMRNLCSDSEKSVIRLVLHTR